ncbi:Zf-FLZ domain [Sesbania bispinosa]|nr:Zf-FLZ domain [Sesbania bispinosa]
MLRKRSRSQQKDQHHMGHLTISDANALGRNIKGHPIFNVPCVFVGLGPKCLLDSDSVRSPTSPLDARVLSNLGNPVRNPRSSSHEGHQRSWDCCKVGLSIVESLEDCSKFPWKILPSPQGKKACLTPQMIKTPNCQTCMDAVKASKSLPKDFCKVPYTKNEPVIPKGKSSVLFEIGETALEHQQPFGKTRSCSLDSCSPLKFFSGLTTLNPDSDFVWKDMTSQMSSPPHFIGGSQNSNIFLPIEIKSNSVSICSPNEFIKSLSASEIELSEDYTCVISHGPNPKTTHIFGDCILETHSNGFKPQFKNEEKEKVMTLMGNRLQTPNQYPSSAFLSFCLQCNKKLDVGKDIYIYGGDKAFCSLACREIMIDEEQEESKPSSESSPKKNFGEQLFVTDISAAT